MFSLDRKWTADIGDGKQYEMCLPGTLDENQIGYPDEGVNQWHPDVAVNTVLSSEGVNAPIATRFTRKYTYTGVARISRRILFQPEPGKRVFLEVERARCLKLLIDGRQVPDFVEPSISTPHVFEVTEYMTGEHEVTFLSDNSYEGLPAKAIIDSSAATDETQTNWNGLLGYIRLRTEEQTFVSGIRVYPIREKDGGFTLTVKVELSTAIPWEGRILLSGQALIREQQIQVSLPEGKREFTLSGIALQNGVPFWDEEEGNLQELTVTPEGLPAKTVSFGIRTFGAGDNGRLILNNRILFLRGEANCAEFPEEGHPPMTVKEWTDVLLRYRSYGVNCMRFHSHCPPEAAFTAADQLGMLMQPELSHWDPKTAFESEESMNYYKAELIQIIKQYANHPSFVMLTLGNELQAGESGHRRMAELLHIAHELDETRLFAWGSNVHYGQTGCDENSDFYTATNYYEKPLRGTFAGMTGHINEQYPSAKTDYEATMQELRKKYHKPVFGFEVGQFEILPDFEELEDFQGISDPVNFQLIKNRAEEKGMLSVWKSYVEATGELSLIGYREEVEAAMRTESFSGLSLLGLQDFPGQGTALVGMMNSHLQPKPYEFAKPERFKSFFRDQLPLVYLPKYTYTNGEVLEAEVKIANFGKKDISGIPTYLLTGEEFTISGSRPEAFCPAGEITSIATLKILLEQIWRPLKLELTITLGDMENTYPIWVYPNKASICPEEVYETTCFNAHARRILEAGGIVYLTPPSTKEALPSSIKAQFTTDFWSVGTFSNQEGGMGQLIDTKHPIFKDFPTEFHTNWQWWPMASQRAAILPKQYQSIITEIDSYAFLRPMTQLLECNCLNGRLLFSTMGLQNLQQYPECRALRNSIYRYLGSKQFKPTQTIEPEVFEELVP